MKEDKLSDLSMKLSVDVLKLTKCDKCGGYIIEGHMHICDE